MAAVQPHRHNHITTYTGVVALSPELVVSPITHGARPPVVGVGGDNSCPLGGCM
jgi:hypothetical protein